MLGQPYVPVLPYLPVTDESSCMGYRCLATHPCACEHVSKSVIQHVLLVLHTVCQKNVGSYRNNEYRYCKQSCLTSYSAGHVATRVTDRGEPCLREMGQSVQWIALLLVSLTRWAAAIADVPLFSDSGGIGVSQCTMQVFFFYLDYSAAWGRRSNHTCHRGASDTTTTQSCTSGSGPSYA